MGNATKKLATQRVKKLPFIPVFNATNTPDMINAIKKDIPNANAIRVLKVFMGLAWD